MSPQALSNSNSLLRRCLGGDGLNLMMPGNVTGPVHHMNFSDVPRKLPLERALLRRILRYFHPYAWYGLLIAGAMAANALLGLVPLILVKVLFDAAIPQGDGMLLAELVGAMILVALVSGLISVGQNYLSTLVGQRVMCDIRDEMYVHLQSMSLGFFTRTKTGEIMSRVTNDVNGVQQVVTNTLVSTATNLVNVVSTLGLIFILNWKLALVSVAVLPFFIYPTRRAGKERRRIASATQAKLAEMNNMMHETLSISGVLLVKGFVRQKDEQARFSNQNRDLMQLQVRQALVGRWFFMWLGLFSSIGPAVIYGYGGWLVIQGVLSVGTVLAFVAALGRLYGPASMLFNVHVEIFTSLALFSASSSTWTCRWRCGSGPAPCRCRWRRGASASRAFLSRMCRTAPRPWRK